MPARGRWQGRGALNLAVIGAGAFGRNHIRLYRELAAQGFRQTKLTAIVESDPTRNQALGEELGAEGVSIYSGVEDLLEARAQSGVAVDAASVCVPTSAHFAVASALLSVGIDVLVEKPIAASTAEADQLIRLAEQHGRILQVGHLERFNPAVAAAEALRNRPMFFEAHRLSIFSPRSLDVDVVLDLMVHDLDIVLTLADSPVTEVRAVGLPIISSKVDIANVRLEFASGCVANFTASRVSTERVRKLRFFQPHQYVSIDYARQDLLVIDVSAEAAAPAASATSGFEASRAAALPPGLSFQKPPVQAAEPLRLELQSFLESVASRQSPRVTGQDGRRALALALEINQAITAHAKAAGLAKYTER